MVTVVITPTGKSYSPRDSWRILASPEHKTFDTKTEALAYLRKRYGQAKRVPMYRDAKGGPPIKVGWVIGFRNEDWSHAPVERWLQQDWVEIREWEPTAG